MRLHLPFPSLALLLSILSVGALPAQTAIPANRLDPTRGLPVTAETHAPLPAQYIWTAGDITAHRPDRSKFPWNRPELRATPHYFRASFHLDTVPAAATLYIAGPRQARVYLNGQLIGDFTSNVEAPINFRVFHADAAHALKSGENVIAIEAVRGRGVASVTRSLLTQQLAYGEVLAVKIIPGAFGVEAAPLLLSNKDWRSTATPADHWQDAVFDDHGWPNAASLGPIEGSPDFFQWSADAGMYGWPGYMGMSPALRTYSLQPQAVTNIYAANSQLTNLASLTEAQPSSHFTITLPGTPTDEEAPSLLLDFGREVAGRLLVESACACDATLSIAYGESEIEAMSTGLTPGQRGGNYMGTNLLEVPAHGIARGPKSAFRYVRITFLRGAPVTAFKSIRLEGIYYPVTYRGSFESSDLELNRIWETAAYTAHLCMQDGIWDAPKRDRGLWAGDLNVEGRVISTVFGDPALTEDTLARLADGGGAPIEGIPGYSAQWIDTLYNLNLHSGDNAFVASQHANLLRILGGMDATLDSSGLLGNPKHSWFFVDWVPGMYGLSPDARMGTQFQYLRAYADAAKLLTELGDTANAAKYEALTRKSTAAAEAAFLDPSTRTYGRTWQVNALAALTGVGSDDSTDSAIWNNVLSHVKQTVPTDQSISPYLNAYVLDAMSVTGHPQQALDWLHQYWGGMLAEGATSFWENYDLRWPKTNFHLSLQADGTSGYFVSLSHGWSSGPAAWFAENVLGVVPTAPGYSMVEIHPALLGLDWAHGTVPTPHGPIKISIAKQQGTDKQETTVDLPSGIAQVRIAIPNPAAKILVNGAPATPQAGYLTLTNPGQSEITVRNPPQ